LLVVSQFKCFNFTLEKLHQRGFPAPFPSGSAGQAVAPGVHYQDTPLDLRAVIQGIAHVQRLEFQKKTTAQQTQVYLRLIELRFCPYGHIAQILNWVACPEVFSISLLCV
jgi:hypothetical protein